MGGVMSDALTDPDALSRAAESFSLGLARASLPPDLAAPGDARAALAAMALSGQALRFRRPAMPIAFDAPKAIADPRRIVPDAVRAILRDLDFAQPGAMGLAVVDRLEARAWRLHPFDLPRLSAFVKPHAERLGPDAMAFASGKDGESAEGLDYFAETIDEANWMNATPARKADFIRTSRLEDPGKARALVEAVFKAQNAQARLRILEAFRIGLSAEDTPFLESLAGDRAPTVKQLAADLAGRIPGAAAFEERIADLFGRMKISTSGFLRKKTIVALEYPANIPDHGRRAWVMNALGRVPLGEMERRLGMPLQTLVETLSQEPCLKAALTHRAIVEGRFDLLDRLLGTADDLWSVLLETDIDDFAALSNPQAAVGFIAAAIKPDSWPELPHQAAIARLYTLLRRPLPREVSVALLSHRDWRAPIATEHLRLARARLCAELVALIHPEARPLMRRILEPLDVPAARQAIQLLALHHLLDSA
jgi:hypothetical protein